MASLNNVLMWSEKEWIPITAEEAIELHPGGSVSAHSGLFRCNLCRQNVSLVYGQLQVPHFRHSAYEAEKDCPERRMGAALPVDFSGDNYELPIRICNITPSSFHFEMGMIRVPTALLTRDIAITITATSANKRSFQYGRERINDDGITYLNIGDTPAEKYNIILSGADQRLYHYWPDTVMGISSNGALFDASSHIRLTEDSDVIVGKKYLLLRPGNQSGTNVHIEITDISKKLIGNITWHLYEICAKDYNESVARFFWDYQCRLTDKPASIHVIWPYYIKSPYLIKHKDDRIFLFMSGEATAKVFPNASFKKYNCNYGSVLSVDCNERQQLISIGRSNILQYSYFWKENIRFKTATTNVIVKDIRGSIVPDGVNCNIPLKQTLEIKTDYDGYIDVINNEKIIEKRIINAGISVQIDGILWKHEIHVYVGKDCVWRARFERNPSTIAEKGDYLIDQLKSIGGPYMKCPHAMRNMALQVDDNAELKRWIMQCIKDDRISRKAFRELQASVGEMR